MSSAREAKLIMRLIDKVSGPGKAVAGSLATVTAATKSLRAASLAVPAAVGAVGKAARRSAVSTAPMSAGMLMAATASARAVYQYEKMGNAAQAVGQLTDKQRESLEEYAMVLNTDFPALNKDILGAAFELNRAGMNFEQMMGSLRSTLNVSLAGDIGIPETADIMTNIAQAMRLPMATREQVAASMKEVEDVLAYAATKSNTDIQEMSTVFRYVAPLAAATGQSLQELAAYSMELANNGIKASNAGTGLRFALMSLIAPSKKAMKAFEALNINPASFITGAQKVSATALAEQLSLDGIDARTLIPQMQELLDDPGLNKAPLKLVAAMGDMITKELGGDGFIDRKILADSLTESLTVLGTQIDFRGLLRAFRKHPNAEAYFNDIFGKRHAAKIMALLAGDVEAKLSEMEANYRGSADRMARIRVKGIVGVWMRLQAAWENFNISLSKTGMLKEVSDVLSSITTGIAELSKTNPELLKFGTYAVLSIAALAPLGFLLSGLAATAAFALNPLTWVGAGLATIAAMNWDQIKGPALQFFKGFAKFVHLKWKQFSVAADGFWAGLTTGLSSDTLKLLDDIGDAFSSLFTTLTGDTNTFSWRRWGSKMGQGVAWGLNKTTEGINAAKATFADLKEWFKNWDWKISSPVDAIKAAATFAWEDVIPVLKDWSNIIISPVWEDYIKPINWGAVVTTFDWKDYLRVLEWGVLIYGVLNWKTYIKKIPWLKIAGSLKWTSLIRAFAWKALRVIPYIGWAALAGELAWDLIIKPLGWDKYLNLGYARQLLTEFKEWVQKEIPWLAAFKTDPKISAEYPESIANFYSNFNDNMKKLEAKGQQPDWGAVSYELPKDTRSPTAKKIDDLLAERQRIEQAITRIPTLHASDRWKEGALAQRSLRLNEIKTELDALSAKASKTGSEIQSNLDVTVKPNVDTSSIDAAKAKVSGLGASLKGLGSTGPAGASMPARKIDGARRKGGPVWKGGLFLVGEDGPEVLEMEGDGNVIPNNQIANVSGGGGMAGGPVSFTNHFHVQAVSPEDFARQVLKIMERQLNRSTQISMSGRSSYG